MSLQLVKKQITGTILALTAGLYSIPANAGSIHPIKEEACNASATEQPQDMPTSESPTQGNGNPDNSEEILTLVKSSLEFISDKTNSVADRMNVAASLEVIFAPDAVIRIVGENGFIIRETASEFLGRISTSRLINRLVPLELSVEKNEDAGIRQIKHLFVKEEFQNL